MYIYIYIYTHTRITIHICWHRLNGYLVLQGSIPFRTAQFQHLSKLLTRKKTRCPIIYIYIYIYVHNADNPNNTITNTNTNNNNNNNKRAFPSPSEGRDGTGIVFAVSFQNFMFVFAA